jgi:KUP system potassium uptake protein
MLMLVTLGLAIGFGKSDNLASAYGIAVSATMLITSALLFIAMREIWGWSLAAAGAVAGAFVIVDASFFAANLAKVAEGGYVPLGVGRARLRCDVYLASRRRGGDCAAGGTDGARRSFCGADCRGAYTDVPGTAVFLTRTLRDAPPVMVWHVRHNRAA